MNYEKFATVPRSEIPEEFKWNLSLIYKSEADWENDIKKLQAIVGEIQKFRGTLNKSPDNIAKTLELEDSIGRILENLSAYARHKSDEDTANNKNLALCGKISTKAAEIDAKTSWIDPELLEIDEKKLLDYAETPQLIFYKKTILDLIREKKHTLSAPEEQLLSLASDVLSAPYGIFNIISNSDLKFPKIQDENNIEQELTQSNFILFLRKKDRKLRKTAFEAFYSRYSEFRNSFAAILDGAINTNTFEARARKFRNCLEASLFDDKIPEEFYHNLISAVKKNIASLYDYFRLRKQKLQLDEMHIYDTYQSMLDNDERIWSWDEAKSIVIESLKPLGGNYLSIAKKALDERWSDVLPNRGKKSGAYSGGSYDSPPYMLLNFNGRIDDLFTLAHELGHSMHSYYSNKEQKYHYADYSIFLAEIASINSELLLHFHLLRNSHDELLKKSLINHLLDEFRATVVRQTMFAEYELLIHQKRESDEPLTADFLCSEYLKLIKLYFGTNVFCDQLIELEWARIPHFHYGFYVYKYATGFAAAAKFANRIISEEKNAVDDYIKLVSAGSSKDVIEILLESGIDPNGKDFIDDAFKIFSENTKVFFS